MGDVRWVKLVRDAVAERGRITLMVVAIAVSLTGFGAVLGAQAVLTREVAASYLGTRPAAATLELPGGVTPALVAQVRALPGVADAEARDVVVARARVGADWRRLLLFVVDDFSDVRLNRFRLERGSSPPPEGAMLVERSALGMLARDLGGVVLVKAPHGPALEVPIAGVVHDPGLAPAWQERSGYGYVTRATLARLGEPPRLAELRVAFSERAGGTAAAEERAGALAGRLTALGHEVTELRVPPFEEHPHQRQLVTILVMLLVFAGLALVLSAVLVASALASLLARQVREIGVMKTLGATGRQVAALYAALVAALGLAAALVAVPAGLAGAGVLSGVVARLLNLELASAAVPAWVIAVQVAAGVLVPLAVAAVPIRSASRRTVRAAIDDHGAAAGPTRAAIASLPAPLRAALRRPARLALTLGLLAAGGAMAITAFQVKRGWEANVAKVYETRHYDVEVVLAAPAPAAALEAVRALPGVVTLEAWSQAPAAFSRPGAVDVVRTYPDRGHGALAVLGVPPETGLVHFPPRAGRWLEPGDRQTDAVVLNHAAAAQRPGLKPGDPVLLSLAGRRTTWRLAGVVEEIGSAGAAYVADAAFARAADPGRRARLVRVATSARSADERVERVREVAATLDRAGAAVVSVQPLAELRTAMGDHVLVLVRMLVALAGVLGTVGVLGLVSAMGLSVLERTRELAILRTLGATPGRLARMLLAEALTLAGLSFALGWALSLPVTLAVGRIVGTLGFLAPLPFVPSAGAALAWTAVGTAATVGATLAPARRAATLVIREALGRT